MNLRLPCIRRRGNSRWWAGNKLYCNLHCARWGGWLVVALQTLFHRSKSYPSPRLSRAVRRAAPVEKNPNYINSLSPTSPTLCGPFVWVTFGVCGVGRQTGITYFDFLTGCSSTITGISIKEKFSLRSWAEQIKSTSITGDVVVESDSGESGMCTNVFYFECHWGWRFLIRRQVDVTQAHGELTCSKRTLSRVTRAMSSRQDLWMQITFNATAI